MRKHLTILLLAGAATAQGPENLGQAVAALEQALADEDVNMATATLSSMPALYGREGVEEADQKAAVKLIGKAAKSKELRMRHGAFAALGAIGAKGSSKYLKKWLNPPRKFKGEIPPSYAEAIRAVGKIADPATLAQLQKLSNHNELPIAQEGTRALGGYHTLPTKRRKHLAIDLVDRLELLSAPPGRRSRGGEAQRMRKASLASATISALKRLTGKDFATPKGWTLWKERASRQRNPFQ